MGLERIAERREIMGIEPPDMGRQRRRADGDGDVGGRRAEVEPATGIGERRDREPGQQHDRPVFHQHGGGGREARQRRHPSAAAVEGAQEEPRGQRPSRRQHRIGVVLQRVKIEERNEREKRQPDGALFAVEIAPGDHPGDPQCERRRRHGKQIEGPVLQRKHGEPDADQPGRQGRVLGRPQRDLARPRHHLAHVEMDVLGQLGEDGVEGPDRAIEDERDRDGAPAALGIAQRIEQPVEPGRVVDSGRDRHRTRHIERRSRTAHRLIPIRHRALPSTNWPPLPSSSQFASSQFAGLDAIDTRGHWLGAISLVDRGRPGAASVNLSGIVS